MGKLVSGVFTCKGDVRGLCFDTKADGGIS